LGKISNNIVTLNRGQYGMYIKCGTRNIAINIDDIENVNMEYAKKLLETPDNKSFKIKDKVINIRNGDYGPYLQIISTNKKQNISIPKKYNLDKINMGDIMQIIADKNGFVKKK